MAQTAGYRINVDENPDPALRNAILKPLRAYNESKIGQITFKPLAICLRDPDHDAVIGGLWGHSIHSWMFVDLLIVPEELRGLGIGTSLLRKAEEIAMTRDCLGLWLQSATFQARGFYEKLGYRAFGAIPDFPPGHDCLFYSKRIKP